VYDPERDAVPTRSYVMRLARIALITLAVCGAFVPAVTGYRAGPDGQTACVAVRDALLTRPGAGASSACLASARDRLFLSAAGLAVIGLTGMTALMITAARRRRLVPAF
jgi:hypothetical protein